MTAGQDWLRNLSIGQSTKDASSILDVTSTTQGSRPFPSMSTLQRDVIGTPATGLIIWNTTTGRLEEYNGLSWGPVNQGYGVYSFNYVDSDSARFESNIGAWFGFDDGSAYVDGTGGTATNLTLSQTTNASFVLEGDGSLSLAKAAADAQYEGISLELIDINREDLGATLYGQLSIDATDANYASGDLKIFAYDVTNSVILPIVNDNSASIPSGKGKVLFRILPSATTAQVRLSLMVNSVNATAWTVYIDDIRVVTGASIEAPVVTFLGTETWTDSEANSTTSVNIYRIGKQVSIEGITSVTGAFAGSEFTVTIPSTYTPDASVYPISSNITYSPGIAEIVDAATNVFQGRVKFITSISNLTIRVSNASATYETGSPITSAIPMTWASGDSIRFSASWVVSGWSDSAILSTTEAANQTAKVFASRTNTISLADNVYTKLTFNTASVTEDTSLMYDSVNDRFVVRQSQDFFIRGRAAFANDATNRNIGVAIYIDGVLFETTVVSKPASGNNTFSLPVATGPIYLSAGKYIELYGFQSDISGATALNAIGYGIGIFSLPDFTVFGVYGEYETKESTGVLASYVTTAGNYGDVTSLSLTPGVWDIDGLVVYESNGATTATLVYGGISTTTGNSATGLTEGDTLVIGNQGTASGSRSSLEPFDYGVVVSTTTTYYLKGRVDNSITNVRYAYKLVARRRR